MTALGWLHRSDFATHFPYAWCFAGVLALLCGVAAGQKANARGDSPDRLTFDLRQPAPPPETGYLHLGGRSATGHDLEINNRYLVLDGQPWLPVMGEFHFSRYPANEWEPEILKMKAAGVQIVSTYVFWIHHEEVEGQFNWSGERDLRGFVQLCAKHGMYVFLRIGPWDHGEARNGGFPDWLLKKTSSLRRNDSVYLQYVDGFYAQIGQQIQGLLWKEGGPIIGVQLENEYDVKGPEGGAAHIAKLKEMAIRDGIVVPLYSVTGWPNQDFPPQEVVPMLGGYPDGFWDGSLRDEPPSYLYLFNSRRAAGDMGAIAGTQMTGRINMQHYPYFEAEAGGGMEASYHRRPLIDADDIAALALTGIGSGVNLYGYYMFHGGANPEGERTTLEESQATGYPNDLPVRNYDYQAPLGEYGQVRESYRKVKMLHLFLNAFGSELAPMTATAPERTPAGPADTSVPRASVRSADGRGFVFVSNYSRKLAMPERKDFQVLLRLPHGTMAIPMHPVDVPANAYFIWPFNLAMDGVTLRSSTAQLITKLGSGDGAMYVFFAIPGIEPTFLFDAADTARVESKQGTVDAAEGGIYVHGVNAGKDTLVRATSRTGRSVQILVLTEREAEELWKPEMHGADYLALSPANLFWDGDRLDVRTTDPAAAELDLFPDPHLRLNDGEGRRVESAQTGLWTEYRTAIAEKTIQYAWTRTRDAGAVVPVKLGPQFSWRKGAVAMAPSDEDFRSAAQWELKLPEQGLDGISHLYLRLDYAGDVGRAYLGGRLIDDDFYNGRPWTIDLERFVPQIFQLGLRIDVLPLAPGAPIYLDSRAWQKAGGSRPVATIKSTEAIPEYESILTTR